MISRPERVRRPPGIGFRACRGRPRETGGARSFDLSILRAQSDAMKIALGARELGEIREIFLAEVSPVVYFGRELTDPGVRPLTQRRPSPRLCCWACMPGAAALQQKSRKCHLAECGTVDCWMKSSSHE